MQNLNNEKFEFLKNNAEAIVDGIIVELNLGNSSQAGNQMARMHSAFSIYQQIQNNNPSSKWEIYTISNTPFIVAAAPRDLESLNTFFKSVIFNDEYKSTYIVRIGTGNPPEKKFYSGTANQFLDFVFAKHDANNEYKIDSLNFIAGSIESEMLKNHALLEFSISSEKDNVERKLKLLHFHNIPKKIFPEASPSDPLAFKIYKTLLKELFAIPANKKIIISCGSNRLACYFVLAVELFKALDRVFENDSWKNLDSPGKVKFFNKKIIDLIKNIQQTYPNFLPKKDKLIEVMHFASELYQTKEDLNNTQEAHNIIITTTTTSSNQTPFTPDLFKRKAEESEESDEKCPSTQLILHAQDFSESQTTPALETPAKKLKTGYPFLTPLPTSSNKQSSKDRENILFSPLSFDTPSQENRQQTGEASWQFYKTLSSPIILSPEEKAAKLKSSLSTPETPQESTDEWSPAAEMNMTTATKPENNQPANESEDSQSPPGFAFKNI